MMTKDPVGRVRASAIRMLTRAYTKKLVPVLHFVLTKDPDARVRMVAMEALAFLKERQAVPWLASSAKFEPVPKAQLVAVKALALIGDKNAAAALATLCESHSNEDARAAAVRALDSLKRYRKLAQPVLARVLGQDRSGKVRAAAMRALATDHSAAACAARAERINDPDGDVRQAVVEQLAYCPARIARPALITAARDRDPRVRGAAVAVLIKAGAPKSKDVLLPILASDKEVSIREQVLRAVPSLPRRDQGAALSDVARRDPEARLRKLAVDALAKQPALVAVSALAAVLGQDRVTEIRAAAAKALTNFKDATAYQALQKAAADDPAEEVRRIAAKGAGKSPAQKAFVDALLPQTIDSSPATRLKAVTQLCSLQVPRTYRALVRALWMDDNASIRTAVAKCFAEIDHPLIDIGLSVAHDTDTDGGTIRAVEMSQKQRVERLSAMVEQLKTGDVAKRMEVLQLLQPSPNPQAREAAEGRLRDADLKVRRAAAITLARYMDRRALQKLMQAGQKEPDAGVRQLINRMYQRLRASWAAGKRPLNINTLITQLKAKDRRLAVWAAKALGTLRDRRAFAPLKEVVKGDDPSVRHAAVVALATFGDVTIVSEAARSEEHKEVKEQLIQLNFLRKAEPEKVIAALRSTDVKEVQRGIEAAAIRQVNKAVPWLVRLALSHVSIGVRQAAVRTLVLYDLPLAQWAIRVAAQHDASKALRRVMWQWAVHTDSGS
jgi:HEAT repeat protein